MNPHTLARKTASAREDPLYVLSLANPVGFLELEPGDISTSRPRACSVGLLLVGSAQLEPSLGPSALEDEAAALCLHAGAKAEFAGSANFAGLIGTLHDTGSLGCMSDGETRAPYWERRSADRFDDKVKLV